ncbi:unnamed protein product [Rotaria sp. Silwood2]|nr:unnamed protein product [Rotaria sp. Silwood2]
MYQHLRIPMKQAQQQLQHMKEQDNNRCRCRSKNEICPTVTTSEPLTTTYDNQMDKDSDIHIEMIHQVLTDTDETLDIVDDFGLLSSEEDTIEFQSELNFHCDVLSEEQDDLLLLDDLFSSNNNQNSHFLHSHATIKTHEFCKQLIEIVRDANISNIHRSRILTLISSILLQPHNSPTI